jgi:hypothetical protein
VVDGVAAEVVDTGDGADVDDVAEVALDHAGHEQTHQMQNGLDVDGDLLVDGELVGGQDVAGARDTRVVDEDVDLQAVQCGGERLGVGDVDGVRDATGVAGEGVEPFGVARHRVNLEAALGESLDDHGSDAGRRSGDEGRPVVGDGHAAVLLGVGGVRVRGSVRRRAGAGGRGPSPGTRR